MVQENVRKQNIKPCLFVSLVLYAALILFYLSMSRAPLRVHIVTTAGIALLLVVQGLFLWASKDSFWKKGFFILMISAIFALPWLYTMTKVISKAEFSLLAYVGWTIYLAIFSIIFYFIVSVCVKAIIFYGINPLNRTS